MLSSGSSSLKQSGLTPGFGSLKHDWPEVSTYIKDTPKFSTQVGDSRVNSAP